MNEHEIAQEVASQGWDWKALALGLVSVLMTLLSWVGLAQKQRIDDHDSKLDELAAKAAKAVTSDDITQVKTEIKGDIAAMERRLSDTIQTGINHVAERIGDVRVSADKAHSRIDDINRMVR